ncbi:MAG: lamin tail domain-containing protein, partial [candidate division WOR-3 bacterium]|nr:lamin tail domain-containing protein [candidate division WOR-3 bacterium]
GSEALELHNETGSSIEMSDYQLVLIGYSSSDTVTFPAGALAADGYITYDPATDLGTNTLSNGGMIIAILNNTGTVIDQVGYGSSGHAPAPIYNWSTARVSSTGDDAVDFNMDDTPTIGLANDAASTNFGSGTVFFNEVFMDTLANSYDFVELYNSSSTGVDISGWWIVFGDDYEIPASTVIPGNGYFVLSKLDSLSSAVYFIPYGDPNYGAMYLFNSSMERIDQIGWDWLIQNIDTSYSCIPNGSRTYYKGYDESTTVDFEFTSSTEGSANSSSGIIETVNAELDYTVSSLSGVGIDIRGELDNAEISIMDVTGRTIYTSNFKNMIFAAKSGVYFVNVKTSDRNYTHKIEVIK